MWKWSKTFGLQQVFSKKEVDNEEKYERTWNDFKYERVPNIKNDVLSWFSLYARYTMNMAKRTGIEMKYGLSFHSLWCKLTVSMRVKDAEHFVTYTDENMPQIARQNSNGRKKETYILNYQNENSKTIFKHKLEKLNDKWKYSHLWYHTAILTLQKGTWTWVLKRIWK